MDRDKRLDILKNAILLEHRGKALYKKVAEQTEVEDVRSIFEMLAGEEEDHIDILERQMKRLNSNQAFEAGELAPLSPKGTDPVLTESITQAVSAASYEAAVISAALDFEKKAVEFYSQRAKEAEDQEEKRLFNWLSEWEKGHMILFSKIDDQIKEKVWFDNRFWPLD